MTIIPLPDAVRAVLESFRPGRSSGVYLEGGDLDPPYPATAADVDEQTLSDLKLALEHLPSDDRPLWVRFAYALKPLGQAGLELWLTWSRKSSKYDDRAAQTLWRSIHCGHIGYKSVFAEATRHGWKNRSSKQHSGALTINDFLAYLPQHRYIHTADGALWPTESINGALPPQVSGGLKVKASAWLDQHAQVHQMTWSPADPVPLINDKLVLQGGWFDRLGARVFNLYRGAPNLPGNPQLATRWLDHLQSIYPDEWEHIVHWLAHRVQRPGDKINHALVLHGGQGVGKDTILEAVKRAIGHWNWSEISPVQMLGRFNEWVKAVVVRIVEAHDLGEYDRYAFYERCKGLLAAPPDVLRVDEKHAREYYVANVCGVIITTNHEVGGLELPADDRRHFVASSIATKEQFSAQYWADLWSWYEAGGFGHVAAYLRALDLTKFDPKEAPRKTDAFWRIVQSNAAPEDAELADLLDALHRPLIVTLAKLQQVAASKGSFEFKTFLSRRESRRVVQHRLQEAGYVAVRNKDRNDGLWKIAGNRQVAYAKRHLTYQDAVKAIRQLAEDEKEESENWYETLQKQ